MRGLLELARTVILMGLFLPGSIPLVIAHSDLELQIQALSQQIDAASGRADLLLQRGDLYRRHLDFEAASEDFAAARRADPGEPLTDFYEGRLALESGAAESAVGLMSRYLDVDPGHAAAWVLLARAELGAGEPGRAALGFNRAIEQSARPAPDLYMLLALSLVADARPGDALAAVNSGLESIPGEVSLLGLGADISLAEGQAGSAQRYLDQIPPALYQLERWEMRAKLVGCIALPDNPDKGRCLADSNAALDLQMERLQPGS